MLEVKTFIVTGAELEQGMCVNHACFGEPPGTHPGRQIAIGSCTLRNIRSIDKSLVNGLLLVRFFDVDFPTLIRNDDKVMIVKTVDGLNP